MESLCIECRHYDQRTLCIWKTYAFGWLLKLAIAFKKGNFGATSFSSIVSRMPRMLLEGFYQVQLVIELKLEGEGHFHHGLIRFWKTWPLSTLPSCSGEKNTHCPGAKRVEFELELELDWVIHSSHPSWVEAWHGMMIDIIIIKVLTP